jgi:hypothetical protein
MHQPRLDNVDKCLIASGIIEYRYLLHTYASFDMKLWIFLPSPCFTPLSRWIQISEAAMVRLTSNRTAVELQLFFLTSI